MNAGKVNMAGIGSKLQAYLSKSTSNSVSDASESSSTTNSWFSSKQDEVSMEETTNGWFSQAQNDPLLPSLVRLRVSDNRNI